jgi:tRNA G18 (ribose-2'-O)-methylase SpoU
VSAPVVVDDPADPRLADYFALTDVSLRRRLEPEHGLFIAESEKVIRRAVAAGYPVRSMLLSERWLESVADVIASTEAPVYLADTAVLAELTGFQVHRGALASMGRLPLPDPADLLAGEFGRPRRVAVFEDIVDHTNLGAAFRSAAALGLDAVLVTPRCADPLYRRSIRVSMGGVFQVPWTRIVPWPQAIDVLRVEGYVTAALTLSDDALTLDELAAREDLRLALVFGTEGDGLRPGTVAAADVVVRIPMAG